MGKCKCGKDIRGEFDICGTCRKQDRRTKPKVLCKRCGGRTLSNHDGLCYACWAVQTSQVKCSKCGRPRPVQNQITILKSFTNVCQRCSEASKNLHRNPRKAYPYTCTKCSKGCRKQYGPDKLCYKCHQKQRIAVVCPGCGARSMVAVHTKRLNPSSVCQLCSIQGFVADTSQTTEPTGIGIGVPLNGCILVRAKEGYRCKEYQDCRAGFWADFLGIPNENRCCDLAIRLGWLGWKTRVCNYIPFTKADEAMIYERICGYEDGFLSGSGGYVLPL